MNRENVDLSCDINLKSLKVITLKKNKKQKT